MLRRLLSGILREAVGSPAPALPTGAIHHVQGFDVYVANTRPDISTSAVLERLGESLDLIATFQPLRMRHMRRDVAQFWITRYACRGAYFPGTRIIMTELTFLARRDITAAPVASSILHEGVHARVDVMGVAAAGRDRAREERLCRRAELTFGHSLPADLGAPVIERALASLAMDDDSVAPVIDPQLAAARIAIVDRGDSR